MLPPSRGTIRCAAPRGTQTIELASRTSTASQAAFSKLIKGATLKVYAGAPHGLTVTHKDKFNADLLTFVKSVQ
jgi:hypothetical protein